MRRVLGTCLMSACEQAYAKSSGRSPSVIIRIAGCRLSKAKTRRQSPTGKRALLAGLTFPTRLGGVTHSFPVRTSTEMRR